MVPAGHHIHSGGEDLLGRAEGDARTARGVLAVGDDEVDVVLPPQFGDEFLDGAPARLANDVGNKEQFHAANVPSAQARASCFGRGHPEWAHLDTTTASDPKEPGAGTPVTSQPGRLRYVAQASRLRVLAASRCQFRW